MKETTKLPSGTNPLLTPDDCDLAETIARGDAGLRAALKERFDFTDMDRLICDPWSVHLASESHPALDALDDITDPAQLPSSHLYGECAGQPSSVGHVRFEAAHTPAAHKCGRCSGH